MRDNKKRLKILLILSLVLNILLIFFYFPVNRTKTRFLVMRILGFSTPSQVPNFKEDLLLTEFLPKSMLFNQDKRKNQLPSFPIVETHGHLGKFFQTSPKKVSEDLTNLGIRYFINLSLATGEEFSEIQKEYNDPRIIHFSGFNWKRMDESEDFVPLMLEDLRKDIQNHTKGIKLWKNFGLTLKKKNGERLKMDDPILDPLFRLCAENKLIISIHTSDPPAFFEPIDEHNERYEELVRKPEWSFYAEEFPKFSDLLEERNRLFAKHPDLRFVSLHFAESAHQLELANSLLEKYPNVYLDIAARIDELGRQPYSTKKFLEKWQDRIFFGTDGPPDQKKLEIYSRFLETEDEYFDYYASHKPRKGFWKIYGIGLSKEVLEKIYYKNAIQMYDLKFDIR
jgi:predicted TIM-barrel fold metal-dependent hydrolase